MVNEDANRKLVVVVAFLVTVAATVWGFFSAFALWYVTCDELAEATTKTEKFLCGDSSDWLFLVMVVVPPLVAVIAGTWAYRKRRWPPLLLAAVPPFVAFVVDAFAPHGI